MDMKLNVQDRICDLKTWYETTSAKEVMRRFPGQFQCQAGRREPVYQLRGMSESTGSEMDARRIAMPVSVTKEGSQPAAA
jgi:hypothetical protein